MDIFLIMGGMFFGGFLAGSCAACAPDWTTEIKFLVSVFGSIAGGVVGFAIAWYFKNEEQMFTEVKKQAKFLETVKPQIVGKNCVSCSTRVMFETDAHFCDGCRRIFCKQCEPMIPCISCSSRIVEAEIVE